MNNAIVKRDATHPCAFLPWLSLKHGFLLGSRAQLENPGFRLPSRQCWAVDESLGQGSCANVTGYEGETRTPRSHCPGRRPLTSCSGAWTHPCITFCNARGNPPISGHPRPHRGAPPAHGAEISRGGLSESQLSTPPSELPKVLSAQGCAASTRHHTS